MGRRILAGLIIVVAVLAAAYLAGPRVPADTTVTFKETTLPDPDAYLARTEGAVQGIRPGLEKEIVWADPATRRKTPLAIVYVHGFSASKGEVRPLPDIVARELGANLFYTRLAGHGMDGPAMATGSVNAWVNDYAEALAIGRSIGERVIVIATSTGATLASWAAVQPDLSAEVAALVMISPNFGPQAAGAEILTLPWGGLIARLHSGTERGFEPANEAQARLWTTRYPIEATLPMAAMVKLANGAPVEKATIPALFIFSDADQVVRPERTRAVAARWGARHDLVAVAGSEDPSNHVIAGDACSPGTTAALADQAVRWLKDTLGA